MSGGEAITTAVALMNPEFRTLIGALHAKEYLEAGVTSVRVVGHSGIAGDIALRGMRSGLVAGPRLQAAGRARSGSFLLNVRATFPGIRARG
jgi:hypothetical protein